MVARVPHGDGHSADDDEIISIRELAGRRQRKGRRGPFCLFASLTLEQAGQFLQLVGADVESRDSVVVTILRTRIT